MKEAIEVLRELPEERQETIARAILDFASHDDGVYHLTDEERREVRAGVAECSFICSKSLVIDSLVAILFIHHQ